MFKERRLKLILRTGHRRAISETGGKKNYFRKLGNKVMLLQLNVAHSGIETQWTVNPGLLQQDHHRGKLPPKGGTHPDCFSCDDDSGNPNQMSADRLTKSFPLKNTHPNQLTLHI